MVDKKEKILSCIWVKDLLGEPGIAKLGTANPITWQPHVTPVWFLWDGKNLLISAFISTRKVKDIQQNSWISVLVDNHTPGVPARAVLMEGKALLVSDSTTVQQLSTEIYKKYLGESGIKDKDPASWIIDPENRIVKLVPEKIFAWGQPVE